MEELSESIRERTYGGRERNHSINGIHRRQMIGSSDGVEVLGKVFVLSYHNRDHKSTSKKVVALDL